MKPILILQQDELAGPGHVLPLLHAAGLSWMVWRADALPRQRLALQQCAGLIVLGRAWGQAPRNVEAPVLALCVDALTHDRPVLALGSGAELLACTAGGRLVAREAGVQGWLPAWLTPQAAQQWSASRQVDVLVQAHQDIELPPRAQRVMFDRRCFNLGFAFGPHLGLQSDLQLTLEMLLAASQRMSDAQARLAPGASQARLLGHGGLELLHDAPARMAAQQRLLARVLRHWLRGLNPEGLTRRAPSALWSLGGGGRAGRGAFRWNG